MGGAIAASAMPIYLTGASMDGMIPCSASCMSALRTHPHLKMSGTPDAGVMDHIKGFHDKHAEHLSAIKRMVPGMEDCPAGEEMSAIKQHLASHHALLDKIYQHATHMSATDYSRGLDARLQELSASGAAITAKEQTITSQAQQIAELRKSTIESPTKREVQLTLSAIQLMGRQAIEAGYPAVFVNACIEELVGTPDKPNNLMLSASALPGGDGVKGPIFRVFELMLMAKPSGALGIEMSGFQGVHREEPGSGMNAETKAAQERHFPKKKKETAAA
jgi:hypothetical protein